MAQLEEAIKEYNDSTAYLLEMADNSPCMDIDTMGEVRIASETLLKAIISSTDSTEVELAKQAVREFFTEQISRAITVYFSCYATYHRRWYGSCNRRLQATEKKAQKISDLLAKVLTDEAMSSWPFCLEFPLHDYIFILKRVRFFFREVEQGFLEDMLRIDDYNTIVEFAECYDDMNVAVDLRDLYRERKFAEIYSLLKENYPDIDDLKFFLCLNEEETLIDTGDNYYIIRGADNYDW